MREFNTSDGISAVICAQDIINSARSQKYRAAQMHIEAFADRDLTSEEKENHNKALCMLFCNSADPILGDRLTSIVLVQYLMTDNFDILKQNLAGEFDRD